MQENLNKQQLLLSTKWLKRNSNSENEKYTPSQGCKRHKLTGQTTF